MSQSAGLSESTSVGHSHHTQSAERSDEEHKQAPRRHHYHNHRHSHRQHFPAPTSSVGLSQSIDPSTTHPAAAVTSSSSSILSATTTSAQHAHQHHLNAMQPAHPQTPSSDGRVFSAATWDWIRWLAAAMGVAVTSLLAGPMFQGFKYGVGYHLATLASTRAGILPGQQPRIAAKYRQPSVQIVYAMDGKPISRESYLTPRIAPTQPSQRAIEQYRAQPAPTQHLLGGGSRSAPPDPYRHSGQPFRIHLDQVPAMEPPVRIYN